MKREVFTIRLAPKLASKLTDEANRHGVSRTTWANHLVERGMLVDGLDKLFPDDAAAVQGSALAATATAAPTAGNFPPEIFQRILFAACFSEALLVKLNASLNRHSSELGTVAAQARDQATAETAALLKGVEE